MKTGYTESHKRFYEANKARLYAAAKVRLQEPERQLRRSLLYQMRVAWCDHKLPSDRKKATVSVI